MMTLHRRLVRPLPRFAAAATITLGLVAAALSSSSSASAATSPCSDAVMSAPTGPAGVSVAHTKYGRVLVVGSGAYAGCSLYMLTSDQLHALSGDPFACSDGPNVLGPACDTVLWPALLTDGAPIAGPGVNPRLLGTVTRTDLGLGTVQQVTYAGQPLYRFLFDGAPGDTQGANLDDPVTSPAGVWYLINPSRGLPATGQALLQLETAPVGGTGPDQTVLAATMNQGFTSVFANATFPVYTLSSGAGGRDGRDKGANCQGECAVEWPPVLTSEWPVAGPGVDQQALGITIRPDGSHQVTYHGRPLFLFNQDAYIGGVTGTPSINGVGADPNEGVWNTIPPLP